VRQQNLDFGEGVKDAPELAKLITVNVQCDFTVIIGRAFTERRTGEGERLFRGTDGSFLLYMSDEKPHAEERIAWLSVRDAISWLNEALDRFGSFWDFAKVVRATFTQERADFLA
jgi:hypothetical protein